MLFFVKTIVCVLFIYIYGICGPTTGLFVNRPSTMVLENNEYKNVVIAIHDSIPEDKTLLDSLKDTMTKASKYLYTATRQRAFFKEIKILLPSSWSNDALYAIPTTENLVFADVIVTDPIRGKRSLPQTRSYDGCGKQGVHVLLTKEFLTLPRIEPYFNDPAKYFIHAFAQFRWGVFQEYAEEGEQQFYTSPSTGRPEPIKCTIMLRGLVQKNDSAQTICYLPSQAQSAHVIAAVDSNTGLYESDCLWRPYPTRQRTKASLMDHQYIKELETFCDDNHTDYMTEHNYEAPSKHNRLCGHRSTWDIITKTDDFKNGKNPPRGLLEAQLQPTFVIMRAPSRKRRAALMIDPPIAKQIDVQQAIGRLKQEASLHDIELRIIDTRKDNISHEKLLSVENISKFLRHQSQNVGGYVLDERIQKATQTFDEEGELNNTHLIIVTNKSLNDVKPMLYTSKQKGLKTSAISSHVGEQIKINIAGSPGYHLAGRRHGHSVLDRLRQVVSEDITGHVIITQDEMLSSRMKPASSCVDIDPSLAKHITFIFHYEKDLPYVDIRSPSNVIYDTESDVCSVDYDVLAIKFHFEFMETGTWTYKVRQSSRKSQKVKLTVISENVGTNSDPVVIRPSVKVPDETSKYLLLHADATQGPHPLIGLKVSARIETPKGDISFLELLDNGAGADISKNDGIYSRVYLIPRIKGLYHVTFVVTGNIKTTLRKEESFIVENDENTPLKKLVSKVSIDGNIRREVSGGTIYIQNTNFSSTDEIAPSRITDLEAFLYIPYRKTIALKWTAPGDDFDHGKPFSYQVFIGYDVTDIRLFLQYTSTGSYDGTGHVTRKRIAAKTSATQTENLLFNVEVLAKSYVFAVRAVDESGNSGDISNVAIAPAVLR